MNRHDVTEMAMPARCRDCGANLSAHPTLAAGHRCPVTTAPTAHDRETAEALLASLQGALARWPQDIETVAEVLAAREAEVLAWAAMVAKRSTFVDGPEGTIEGQIATRILAGRGGTP